MPRIIDASSTLAGHAVALRQANISTVIRYFNIKNSSGLPTKCLTRSEADALSDAGLSLVTAFEQGGGAKGGIADFSVANGTRDSMRAVDLARQVGQPEGSAIYFCVDKDFIQTTEILAIRAYFNAVRAGLGGKFRLGVYGSGHLTTTLVDAGLADLIWLSVSRGWQGYKACLARGDWALCQTVSEAVWPGGVFGFDENVAGPAHRDFGQFVPDGGTIPMAISRSAHIDNVPALYTVSARTGLNLRRGAGTQFDVVRTLPAGTLVHGLLQSSGWMLVDIDGDGLSDGYLSADFLTVLAGGLPTAVAPGETPYDVARQEMAMDVSEVPGASSNPRIVLYHSSTSGGPAPDSVSWCSSFVNWCVTRAGLIGTNSKWAMSWHTTKWGSDVTEAPQEGDIAVFRRRYSENGVPKSGGHAGFYVSGSAGAVQILGGNQSNRIRISTYPRNGTLGGQEFELISIRHPDPAR